GRIGPEFVLGNVAQAASLHRPTGGSLSYMQKMATGIKIAVVGGGLAGLAAAMKIAEAGHSVDLFSVVPVKRSHSVCAQGGINGAVNTKGEGDSTWEHLTTRFMAATFSRTSRRRKPCAKWRLRSSTCSIGWECPFHGPTKACSTFADLAAPNITAPHSPEPPLVSNCCMR